MKTKPASHLRGILKLIRNSDGATAIEYGLLAALIAVGSITTIKGMGNQLKTTFTTTTNAMSTASA